LIIDNFLISIYKVFECLRKIGDCKNGTRKPETEKMLKMEKGESMTKSGVGILK